MKNSKLLQNVLFNCLIGFVLSFVIGVNPAIGAAAVNGVGLAMHVVKHGSIFQASSIYSGVTFFEGLAAEVWIPLVIENPYPDASFLNAATDMSALVDNDSINLAEAGADPDVLKNNTVFPIPDAVAEDTPLKISLNVYDTTSTIVRNAIAVELAYDQRLLYANKHKKALAKRIGMDAAYSFAPAEASSEDFNTILNLAANDSMIDAIIDLQKAYNDFDDDGTARNLVLNPNHMAKIAKEDKVLYKSIMAEKGATFYGFRIWTYSQNPLYITADEVKAAYGVAYNPAIHKRSSFAFIGSEVMRATGTTEMFSRLKDPDVKGDKFNFQQRALVLPLRNKFQGAILQ